MRVEEKLWSGMRVKRNSMSIFYVVLSTCCVGPADLSCHLVYLFCRLVQPCTQASSRYLSYQRRLGTDKPDRWRHIRNHLWRLRTRTRLVYLLCRLDDLSCHLVYLFCRLVYLLCRLVSLWLCLVYFGGILKSRLDPGLDFGFRKKITPESPSSATFKIW